MNQKNVLLSPDFSIFGPDLGIHHTATKKALMHLPAMPIYSILKIIVSQEYDELFCNYNESTFSISPFIEYLINNHLMLASPLSIKVQNSNGKIHAEIWILDLHDNNYESLINEINSQIPACMNFTSFPDNEIIYI